MADRVVPETLLVGDKVTLTAERLADGKIRLTSAGWDGPRVILADQTLEVRWRKRQVHLIRRHRLHEEADEVKLAGADDAYGEFVEFLPG